MFGVIAKKVGSTVMFADDGRAEHITLLEVEDCVVLGYKTKEVDGYSSVILGSKKVRTKLVNKPQRSVFDKIGVEPRSMVKEFRLDKVSEGFSADVGSEVLPSIFSVGDLVHLTGNAKGKGFAGTMKRHNFRGLEASHGVSISHRSLGSTGQRSQPGKVFKGKRMPGRLGGQRVTVKNLRVIYISGSVFGVRGAVPGPVNGSIVVLKSIVS